MKLDVFNPRGERAASIKGLSDDPLDLCACGDYRHHHIDGHGACKHNKPKDLTHGYKDCTEFRLSSRALRDKQP